MLVLAAIPPQRLPPRRRVAVRLRAARRRWRCWRSASTVQGGQRWINLGAVPVPAVGVRQAAADHRAGRADGALPRLAGPRPADADGDRLHGRARAAGVPRAGLRYRAGLRRDHVRHAVRARRPVAALRLAGLGRCCRHAAHGLLDPARRRRRGAAALPEGPPDLVPAPRPGRHAGRRVPPDPVARSRSGRAASPEAASRARPRPGSTTCPSMRPTSSSRWSARSAGSSGAAWLLGALHAADLARR